MVTALEAEGLPLPHAIRGTLAVPEAETTPAYRAMVEGLPQGATHVALHCMAEPDEIAAIAPAHAGWRVREYALLTSGEVAGWWRSAGMVPIGYCEVRRLWNAALAALRAASTEAEA